MDDAENLAVIDFGELQPHHSDTGLKHDINGVWKWTAQLAVCPSAAYPGYRGFGFAAQNQAKGAFLQCLKNNWEVDPESLETISQVLNNAIYKNKNQMLKEFWETPFVQKQDARVTKKFAWSEMKGCREWDWQEIKGVIECKDVPGFIGQCPIESRPGVVGQTELISGRVNAMNKAMKVLVSTRIMERHSLRRPSPLVLHWTCVSSSVQPNQECLVPVTQQTELFQDTTSATVSRTPTSGRSKNLCSREDVKQRRFLVLQRLMKVCACMVTTLWWTRTQLHHHRLMSLALQSPPPHQSPPWLQEKRSTQLVMWLKPRIPRVSGRKPKLSPVVLARSKFTTLDSTRGSTFGSQSCPAESARIRPAHRIAHTCI